ncbi:VTS1 [Fusarium albosuccineum]|uniref:VTS1 n=1 Tax=Fusarium albosuccineum TaxID=1237068 RepID=A0A8H4P291_9HYPO|nr:VTS1 [Fusarium albosuccineum]
MSSYSSLSSFSSSIPSSTSSGSASSSPSLSFRHHVSSHHDDGERIGDEMHIIQTWFSVLNDDERSSALTSIAELPSLREIEPMIQALKERKRELWRRQEELVIQPATKPKWPMPAFPHGSQDPRWVAKWLRALRLHKYEKCLTGLSPAQVSRLSDEDLQQLGVDTVGARTKLLRAIQTG